MRVSSLFGALAATGCAGVHAPMEAIASPRVFEPGGSSGRALAAHVDASDAATPGQSVRNAQEMLDVRASLEVVVANVAEASATLRERARGSGGRVVSDRARDRFGRPGAELSVRVPPEALETFLAAVAGLGSVRAREVVATDVSAEYRDLDVQLANLEATIARLRELEKRAEKTSELLEIEREMTRVSTEIDRVKGRRAFLADRVAFATVDVVLVAEERVRTPTETPPRAFVHPGLGVVYLHDARGSRGADDYVGASFTLAGSRHASLELEGYGKVGGQGNGLDLMMVTAGTAAFSELFGGGKREWLNPYVGARVGYARRLDANEGVVAGVVGVELWKGEYVAVDAHTRALVFLGAEPAHPAIAAGLGVSGSF